VADGANGADEQTRRARRARRALYRPMVARDIAEHPRASTPLELLFDLCFVVAVSLASAGLHHSLSEGHIGPGVRSYAMVFFAIWWAWMNFSWFASAYDTDDLPYRLATMVQIVGVLVVAAGILRAFTDRDFAVVTLGYAIMRASLALQWVRAGRGDAERRSANYRYAAGIVLCMVGWGLLLLVPHAWLPWGFVIMVGFELAVPPLAEFGTRSPWHPGHIAERYGLFTLIVLGESVLSATTAVQSGLDSHAHGEVGGLLTVAGSGILIVFSMWWIYFDSPAEEFLLSNRIAFVWGYSHYLVFASVAAVGAGLAVAVDHETHHSELSARAAQAAVAVPVAVFLLVVFLVHVRLGRRGRSHGELFPLAAALVTLSILTPAPLPVTAVLLVVLVTLRLLPTHPAPAEA